MDDGTIKPDLPTTLSEGEKVELVIPLEKLASGELFSLEGKYSELGSITDEEIEVAKGQWEAGARNQVALFSGL